MRTLAVTAIVLGLTSWLPAEVTFDAEQLKRSVVVIEALDKYGEPLGHGSGFAVAERGVVATNVHVLEGGHRFKVTLADGSVCIVEGIWTFDRENDLALIQLADPEGAGNLPPLLLADDDEVQVGMDVFAVGHPRGLRFTVTRGIISAINRRLNELGPNESPVAKLQSDVAIAGGSSGGPWINSKGEVVGVTVSGLIDSEAFNFAAHVQHLRALLERDRDRLLPRDHLSGEKALTSRWKALFPGDSWKNLPELTFTGPGGDRNVIAFFKPDGEIAERSRNLQLVSGQRAAIGLESGVDEFELEMETTLDGTGNWFLLFGWDGANGYLMHQIALRRSGAWSLAEIRDGKAVAGENHYHSGKTLPAGYHRLTLQVEEKKATLRVGSEILINHANMPALGEGDVILGMAPNQYGSRPMRIRRLRIRGL